uniref:Uncharacterized protein n=1 Tax=Tetradesmus obliquus TaxID=3088 RepID=A0A383V941_TETOB|eukprot:jgi/Sobl393_1/9405/SZX61470.1
MRSYGTSNEGQAVEALHRNAHSVAGTGISSTSHRTAALPGVAVIGFQGSGKSSTINALIRHWNHTARGNNEDADMEQELAQLESSGINWLQLLQCDRAYRDADPDCSKQALDECNRVVQWSDDAAAAAGGAELLGFAQQDTVQVAQWDAQAGLEGPRHLGLAWLDFDPLKADYLAATGNEGHTSITSAAYGPGDSSDDEDQVSMADATNCLHKEPVRLALRLLGHFQPAEQLRAFTHMMQLPGPVTFPSALRDVMGCTYTYRPAQQAAPMPPQLWRVLAKCLSLSFLQPAYNPLCAALQGCRVSLGSPEQCGMQWSLMDTRGTSTTSAAQLRHLEAQGLMPVSAALFLVASSPEGEASAGDMHQLAKSMLLAPVLRSLASRPAAAAAADAAPSAPVPAAAGAAGATVGQISRPAAAAAAAAAAASVAVPAAPSSAQLPIALVLLGDKVFADALSAVRRAYDAARKAAAAACLGQLITQNDAERQLLRCSRGESPDIPAAAAPDFSAACFALQQACRVLQDRQQRGERNLLGQLVQRLRWQPQCMGATEAAIEACIESCVQVITLYPRCVSGSHPGFPKLDEQQGGYTSLQDFLQQVADSVQGQAAELQQLQQLQDLAAAATAVFRRVPELCSMAASASAAAGGAAGDPEQLLQLLQTQL